MREIEFRGKILFDNEQWKWIAGDLEHFTASDGREMVRIRPKSRHKEFVIPKTVGQWTGLKDKNGVKIYEGDVLKFSWDSIGERVEFYGVVRFCEVGAAFRYWEERFKVWSTFCSFKSKEMEVIGNIFDDPELEKKFGEIYREAQ